MLVPTLLPPAGLKGNGLRVGGNATAKISMLNAWLEFGNVPFAAVTVPAYVPNVVGLPEMMPDELRLRPGGNPPPVTEYVIGDVPLAR